MRDMSTWASTTVLRAVSWRHSGWASEVRWRSRHLLIPISQTHVQRTVSRCFGVLRQLLQICRSVPTDTFQTLMFSIVLTVWILGTACCASRSSSLPGTSTPVGVARVCAADVWLSSIRPHHRSVRLSPLAASPGARSVQICCRINIQSFART